MIEPVKEIGICATCGQPFTRHCNRHVIACCPGKCNVKGEPARFEYRSVVVNLNGDILVTYSPAVSVMTESRFATSVFGITVPHRAGPAKIFAYIVRPLPARTAWRRWRGVE